MPPRAPPSVLAAAFAALIVLALIASRCSAAGGSGEVGFSGKPGDLLPPDTTLQDDTGATVRLGDLMDRPLLVTFVPFSCSRRCPLLLGGLAEALGRLPLRPGIDYAALTVSIDADDTPEKAAAAKRNYLPALGAAYPSSAWKFLTGDRAALGRLAAAAGLRFQRHGEHFFHPEVLLAVSPGGTISSVLPVEAARYNGRLLVTFGTTELEQALAAARLGRVLPGRPPEPLYCLPFERAPERSFFRILKAFGVVNLLVLGAVFAWLAARRDRPAGRA